MLVAKPFGDGRRQYCYGEFGIFDAISRKMLSSVFKKDISTGAKSAIAQTVVGAVVSKRSYVDYTEGCWRCSKRSYKQGESLRLGKEEITYVTALTANAKKTKININSLIDGSGIVID